MKQYIRDTYHRMGEAKKLLIFDSAIYAGEKRAFIRTNTGRPTTPIQTFINQGAKL